MYMYVCMYVCMYVHVGHTQECHGVTLRNVASVCDFIGCVHVYESGRDHIEANLQSASIS